MASDKRLKELDKQFSGCLIENLDENSIKLQATPQKDENGFV